MRREETVVTKTLVTMAMAAVLVAGAACKKDAPPAPRSPAEVAAPASGRVAVTVDGEGYHPATIRAAAGRQLTLVFTRTTDECCGQQLVFPSTNVRRDLPLNQPVEVPVTVPATGSLAFTCGMNMYQGSVVVQ
jgi:plastocyanin domain-containing protein